MIKLDLTIPEVEAVVAGLRKLPMKLIEETVNKIKIQAIPQIQAIQAAQAAEAQPSAEPTNPAADEAAPTE